MLSVLSGIQVLFGPESHFQDSHYTQLLGIPLFLLRSMALIYFRLWGCQQVHAKLMMIIEWPGIPGGVVPPNSRDHLTLPFFGLAKQVGLTLSYSEESKINSQISFLNHVISKWWSQKLNTTLFGVKGSVYIPFTQQSLKI